MASNIIKPNDAPRRANVPREVPVPEAVPVTDETGEVALEPTPQPKQKQPKSPKPSKPTRERREEAETTGPRSGWSLFSLLDRITSMDGLFREGLPVHYLPKLLFVMLLTLLYIGNTHYGNRMNRSIQRLKQETEDLRADYTTLKSDYMEASKQSEVARKVAALGMVESASPPFRITVPAGHLEASALELMPVLTADTLAARAARDSTAAHLADSLAGRHRYGVGSEDSGPEIIAPPQPLGGDSLAAAALPVVTPVRAKENHTAKPNKQLKDKKKAKGKPKVKVVKSVQKSTNKHKPKPANAGNRSTNSHHQP